MSDENNVVSLAERKDDNRLWSVEQMLEDTLLRLLSGEVKAKRAMVVLLDGDDDECKNGIEVVRCNLRAVDMVWVTTIMQARWVAKVRGTEK